MKMFLDLLYLMVVVSFFVRGSIEVLNPQVNTYFYNTQVSLYNKTYPLYGSYTGFNAATMREKVYN